MCHLVKRWQTIISASDDKTIRFWDVASKTEVKKVDLPCAPGLIELSKDGTVLCVPCSKSASFWDVDKYEKTKDYEIPTTVTSISLHPEKSVFVCGGEDFKMYKFDYSTGLEIESFKGHFGPVHCVRFSPDGELYGSGSEDGTLRLWQTTVGKTYGLWKCVVPEENDAVKAET